MDALIPENSALNECGKLEKGSVNMSTGETFSGIGL